jgi:hypothetical protein
MWVMTSFPAPITRLSGKTSAGERVEDERLLDCGEKRVSSHKRKLWFHWMRLRHAFANQYESDEAIPKGPPMTREQQAEAVSTRLLTLAIPSAAAARPTRSVEIIRVESELRAIDELMADLTDEFVAEAAR